MSNKTKRISIFRFCAPLASKILGHNEQLYSCPICGKEYPEESANNGELTLEDVPPRSMGGRGLLLTCKNCNSQAGHKIDFYFKNQQVLQGFAQTLTGNNAPGSEKTSGIILINDERFPVNIQQKDEYTEIKIIEKANNPSKVDKLKNYLVSLSTNNNWDGAEFKIDKTVKLDSRLLKIAYLKSGFLLVTAMLGYTYAFDKRLSIVREQISNPEKDLLGTSFWIVSSKDQPFPRRCMILISNPLPLFLITFDNSAVILPSLSSPTDLYEILKRESEKEQIVSFTGKRCEWPKKALMVLDI